ncbi:MAG TPA: hypothetical protein PLJ35_08175 [Anaerolineae bacterium]|nr:hypothetical protein [Anaerolineae bacterium]HOQ98785.1 hypothetical protein [Anaerolineae bacterium]HPL29146.1 hypothetical protein [Anaerolineae bacterium]
MTQAIYCCNHEGLVVASDSLALRELEGGQVERLTSRKLFAVGPYAVVLTAGAPVGAEMATELAQWLQPRRLEEFADLLALSRDFLAGGYARRLRDDRSGQNRAAGTNRHLYFIVAGYRGHSSSPYDAVLLESQAGELPFKESHLGRVFTLPRRLVQEGHLTRQIAEGASLRELAESCLAGLELAAERNPESVGGPFHIATVTERGVTWLEQGN